MTIQRILLPSLFLVFFFSTVPHANPSHAFQKPDIIAEEIRHLFKTNERYSQWLNSENNTEDASQDNHWIASEISRSLLKKAFECDAVTALNEAVDNQYLFLPLTHDLAPTLHTTVAQLCSRMSIALPLIVISACPRVPPAATCQINAHVSALIVSFDCLAHYSLTALEGIIMHELVHIKNRHSGALSDHLANHNNNHDASYYALRRHQEEVADREALALLHSPRHYDAFIDFFAQENMEQLGTPDKEHPSCNERIAYLQEDLAKMGPMAAQKA